MFRLRAPSKRGRPSVVTCGSRRTLSLHHSLIELDVRLAMKEDLSTVLGQARRGTVAQIALGEPFLVARCIR